MDRYLAILLSPRRQQSSLMAVAAFNSELAQIPHATSDPMLTAIRLQWWRDALEGACGKTGKTGNPVADALIDTVRSDDLPSQLIDEMLDAHERLHMSTIGDVGEIGSVVEAPLYELSALVLGGKRGDGLSHASIAAAIACAAAKSRQSDDEKLGQFAALKRRECAKALDALSAEIFPAFLPVSLVDLYLEGALEGPVHQLRRLWTIWRAHRKRSL